MNILVHNVADYYIQIYEEDINRFGANSPIGRDWRNRIKQINRIVEAADKGYTYTAEALYRLTKLYHGEG